MALSSVVRTIELELSDVDRGVYETLDLKVAQHPSESAARLVARILAFALEHGEGVEFSAGLAATDQPALWQRDLTGRLLAWIEVGTPAAERLHKASKAAGRVAVYCHKRPDPWLRSLAGAKVHRSEELELVGLDPATVEALGEALGRRSRWQLTRTEGTVYLDTESGSHVLPLVPLPWPESTP
jgi:uncharacterized protein YaeQ